MNDTYQKHHLRPLKAPAARFALVGRGALLGAAAGGLLVAFAIVVAGNVLWVPEMIEPDLSGLGRHRVNRKDRLWSATFVDTLIESGLYNSSPYSTFRRRFGTKTT